MESRLAPKMEKIIIDKCDCPCHKSNGIQRLSRPNMNQLHQFIQTRQWKIVKRAIRADVSVSMRIADSSKEDSWFSCARDATWRRDILCECNDSVDLDTYSSNQPTQQNEPDKNQSNEEDSLPVRYWVRHQHNGQSAILQKRTLLHSISKLKFYSDEAIIAQLSSGNCEELHDLVEANLTAKMIIDASMNELRSINEGYYNESIDDEMVHLDQCFDKTCRKCSCYYQSQYCPPVGLDTVEKYGMVQDEEADQSLTGEVDKVLHKSVLTMTDGLGATALHLLTGEGSAHVDLITTFLDGCRSVDKKNKRRPTLGDLLSAQNGHGCTPLHFLSDSASEEALRIVVDRLRQEYDSKPSSFCTNNLSQHPLAIQDNEGDTALHYACSNGANAQVLTLLTTSQPCAVLMRNICGRLPIDDLIAWYADMNQGESDNDSDSADDYENDDESASDSSEIKTEERFCSNPNDLITQALKAMLAPSMTQPSLSQHCRYYLWDRMWILIQTGASYIITAATSGDESCNLKSAPEDLISASIYVTKLAKFPAIALVASVLLSRDNLVDADVESNSNMTSSDYTRMALLQENSLGFLPLHMACGNASQILPSSDIISLKNYLCNANISQSKTLTGTVFWNTEKLPCSMISYLLHLCPESAQIPNREGRLPLQLFLDGGYDANYDRMDNPLICVDFERLLAACPESIRTPDICSHMYPFQTAAASKSELQEEDGSSSDPERLKSIEMTYRLILEDPSLCRKAT